MMEHSELPSVGSKVQKRIMCGLAAIVVGAGSYAVLSHKKSTNEDKAQPSQLKKDLNATSNAISQADSTNTYPAKVVDGILTSTNIPSYTPANVAFHNSPIVTVSHTNENLMASAQVVKTNKTVPARQQTSQVPTSKKTTNQVPAVVVNTNAPSRINTNHLYETSWNISDVKTSSISNANAPFKVTQFTVSGQQFYDANGRGHEGIHTNTLANIIYDTGRTDLVFNDDERIMHPDASRFYIPTLVTNSSGVPLTKIKLKRNDPNVPTINRHAWSLGGAGKDLDTVTYTHEDMPFHIKTLVMNSETNYVVIKDSSPTYPEKLNFYILPKLGTNRRITPNGDMILESSRGIYDPVGVSNRQYEEMLVVPQVKTNSPAVQTNPIITPTGSIIDN